jgi:hypothetical protein
MNESNDKFLTKEEQLKLELNYERQLKMNKECMLMERDIVLNKQNIEILKLKQEMIILKIEKQKLAATEKRNELEKNKKENRKFTLSIATKYELDEKWGFDPDTGKLV